MWELLQSSSFRDQSLELWELLQVRDITDQSLEFVGTLTSSSVRTQKQKAGYENQLFD
ncbi:hypothetical protein MAL01_06105 [Leptospira noguchii]|uniref:hypothetical protein n=1 Tax=Leptospira noguchii TaxID=28182 RepID=UPI001FB5729D|nr:hypothetical protein [Leptospira noguchii]UOG35244.1 hypothetical protein MAL02_05960 [Leptospira noguchii]UOG46159.1 hypothetical protein MAL01_06105 [Leptospira noguchii]